MIISSRPTSSTPSAAGANGIHTMTLNDEQLTLIVSLVCYTRLGQSSVYSAAAFELLQMFESVYGTSVIDDAINAIDLRVTIEDDQGTINYISGSGEQVTLEV